MKVKAAASDLTTYFGMLQNVLAKRQTIPALSAVKVSPHDGGVVLRATDTEVTHRVFMPAIEVAGSGMLVPGKRLYEMVKLLPPGDVVTLDSSGDKAVKVKGSKFSSTLQTYPVDEYPPMPEPGETPETQIPGPVLREMLARTKFVPEEGDTRYFLFGLNMEAENGQFRVVGTDGKRMSVTMAELGVGTLESQIVPQNAIGELWLMLADYEGDVIYQIGAGSLFFSIPGQRLCVQRVDGVYPSYEKVIPAHTTISALIDRVGLLDTVRRVGLVMDKTKNSIRLAFEKNRLSVSSSCHDIGTADEPLDIEYDGDAFEFGVSAKFLAQFLRSCSTERVVFSTTAGAKILRWEPDGESGYVHVISSMEVPK